MLLFDKITVIIPTHERHHYLKRSLDYWSQTGIQIIVADSSTSKYQNQIPDNVSYNHYPRKSYFQKLNIVLRKIETDYSTFCADDDFITLTGMSDAVDFLEKNPDFTLAHGRYIAFEKKDGMYVWSESGYQHYSLVQEDPLERFINHFSHNRLSTYYAVHRTETLYHSWKCTINCTNDLRFGELLPTLITIIHGKMKNLDIFYAARQRIETSTGQTVDTLVNFIYNGTFNKKYINFKICLTNELVQHCKMPIDEAEKIIDKGMKSYMVDHCGYSIGLLTLKQQIKKIIEKLGLLPVVRNIKRVNQNKKLTLAPIDYNNPEHPYYEHWLQIDRIIKKYNI